LGIRSKLTSICEWSDEAVRERINQMTLRKALWMGKLKKPQKLWKDVSNSLWLAGHDHFSEACRKKFNSLQATNSKVKLSNGRIGKRMWNPYAAMAKLSGDDVPSGSECNGESQMKV